MPSPLCFAASEHIAFKGQHKFHLSHEATPYPHHLSHDELLIGTVHSTEFSLSYPKYLHPAFKLFCTISWYQAPQTVGPQHWPLPVTLWGIPYSSSELDYLKNLGIWTLEALQQLATLGLYLKWQQLIRTEWQPSSVTRNALFSLLKITHHSLLALCSQLHSFMFLHCYLSQHSAITQTGLYLFFFVFLLCITLLP